MHKNMDKKNFILASASPQRIALLRQIGIEPKKIQPADINEECLPHEKPLPYVRRMAYDKAAHISKLNSGENILACDTIVAVGQRILHKAQNEIEQRQNMKLLSGRTHRVISSVCLITKSGRIVQRTVESKVYMKKLDPAEIDAYLASNDWQGVCGYRIEGRIAAYVKRIVGSYSGIVGLPLHETVNMLKGEGII